MTNPTTTAIAEKLQPDAGVRSRLIPLLPDEGVTPRILGLWQWALDAKDREAAALEEYRAWKRGRLLDRKRRRQRRG